MFCLYLRGQSTFWGYFFTGGALSYRPFGFWWHFGPKWPFGGLASMEFGWPQKSWDLIKWYKSALHAKFDHYTPSGSGVMCDSVQKTSNAHPPFHIIYIQFSIHKNHKPQHHHHCLESFSLSKITDYFTHLNVILCLSGCDSVTSLTVIMRWADNI